MKRILFRSAVAAVLLAGVLVPVSAQDQELPRFRSSVELTSIDAGVYDDRGRPIADLGPGDFSVEVDGDARHVVSAEWISLETPPGPAVAAIPDGYSSNGSATGGRLILIVIDQPNIRFGGTTAIRKAMFEFIDNLEPSDRAAVVGIGNGSPSTPFTSDRERLKKAIEGMVGQYVQTTHFFHGIALSEAIDIERGNPATLQSVIGRECRDASGRMLEGAELDACVFEIRDQAKSTALDTMVNGQQTISSLRSMLMALKAVDVPKTLILVSEGFTMRDDFSSVVELGAIAAAARTSIYALKLDDGLFTMAASEARAPIAAMDDRQERAAGLETLAGASRGSLFNVVGNGAGVFQRIKSELSGYYLLGVESGASDRDGKLHPIKIAVTRRGATVRARRALLAPPENRRPISPREAVMSALALPLPLSALPLRVASYSLQGPEPGKVQLLIHAEVGSDYTMSRTVAMGYVISDRDGRIVASEASNARLAPVMTGVPSALQFTRGASLPPGDYQLKLAIAEGDRVGTVEHTIHAGVVPAGGVSISDLMVGGPVNRGDELLQPTVGYSVVFGSVHGYIEAYGDGVGGLTARYEIAPDDDAPAVLDTDVSPRLAGGGTRAIFTRVMPARQLPPGRYVLRVTLSSGGETVKVATRPFEIAAPAVLMSSATGADATLLAREVYLPVAETMLAAAFNPSDVAHPAVVQAFRERVPPVSQPAFDKGVQSLAAGEYGAAEVALKSAINPDLDSSAVIAYLAAVYAATGHDTEAAGAFQTALIDGSDIPEVYEWLAGSLIRNRDMGTARGMLEEAIAKWPSDTRFARPMALVYATFGQGVQAVRSLERYLAEHRDDAEALFMGVEWIYQLRAAGMAAHSPTEDLKLAESYAAAYARAKGPKASLVKQWVAFLESKSR